MSIAGCSSKAQDKPLPYNQENIEKLTIETKEALKSFSPSMANPQDSADRLIKLSKILIEEKMGYSFDKTIRALLLTTGHEGGIDLRYYNYALLIPGFVPLVSDPKNALEKEYITQRTYDLIEIGKNAKTLSKKEMELLDLVAECQSKNQGVCYTDSINEMIRKTLLATNPTLCSNGQRQSERRKQMCIDVSVITKYNPARMGSLFSTPDGQKFNTNSLIDKSRHFKFVINKNQVDLSRRYNKLVAEEKKALFP